jgi:hypothetical protein
MSSARTASVAAASTTGRTDRHVVHAREPARRPRAIAVRESRIGGRLRLSKSEGVSTQEVGYYEYSRGPIKVRLVHVTPASSMALVERAMSAEAESPKPCGETGGEPVEIERPTATPLPSCPHAATPHADGGRRGTISILSHARTLRVTASRERARSEVYATTFTQQATFQPDTPPEVAASAEVPPARCLRPRRRNDARAAPLLTQSSSLHAERVASPFSSDALARRDKWQLPAQHMRHHLPELPWR